MNYLETGIDEIVYNPILGLYRNGASQLLNIIIMIVSEEQAANYT
jgi:hypothetical protein